MPFLTPPTFRLASEADYPAIAAMHAEQGLPYALPDLRDRSIVLKLVAEGDAGLEYAALLRLTAEAYLIGTPRGTPVERWDTIRTGNEVLGREALNAGFTDLHAWIPPQIDRAFNKRLRAMGWGRCVWPSYCRKLEE